MRTAPAVILMIAGAAFLGWLLALVPGSPDATGMPLDEFVACGIRLVKKVLQAVAVVMQP